MLLAKVIYLFLEDIKPCQPHMVNSGHCWQKGHVNKNTPGTGTAKKPILCETKTQ